MSTFPAAPRIICALHNLLEEFQTAFATPIRPTLVTLRTTVFAHEAVLGVMGRQPALRLLRPTTWRERHLTPLQRWVTRTANRNAAGEAAPAKALP